MSSKYHEKLHLAEPNHRHANSSPRFQSTVNMEIDNLNNIIEKNNKRNKSVIRNEKVGKSLLYIIF